ncbi:MULTISPECIES: BC1881 family protein [Eisenbergiella]|nr:MULTISPECIES: BC1881 family protein [Eisenbergiella]MCI6707047.1 BC1881 family protein [Eisenbergiella massiliensis]MDY5524898.1 BC1881 family protein [Eisenbergiella porci]
MNDIEKYKTYELVEEIKKREGVTCQCTEPYQNNEILVNGPAIVLIITD